ncbi:SGNH/GDSL hydrolase family protein [Patulibacter americanus]|uniref:SGNH/GDSL hydrolase family protein n=1 Tax=Patulibacter americanus TaxID=588672 RepID=UPI001B7FADE5|nr:SGNH/GDSL hydrolase family protein [Patulibacter americanus]
MKTTRTITLALAASLLLTAGCAEDEADGPSTPEAPKTAGDHGLSKVLFLGDSVAAGQAKPLAAALKASGVGFRSEAADGGGNVVGPFADKGWKTLPDRIASAKPSVVVYQLTTYDWGSAKEQQAGYRRLVTTATATGAKVLFVTMPPIRPDDFYRPHMAELDRAPAAARAVAADSWGKADVLDAAAVWGSTYRQTRDGKADRSADGIHTCPQGAARFTGWLLDELAKQYRGFAPASGEDWANTGWSADKRFKGC